MPVNEEMTIEDAIKIAKVICLRETGTERTAIQMLIDEAARYMDSQKPDPDWKAICEKCHDGDIEPDCEYFGAPNGCNSPIYGKHPKSNPENNAAAKREREATTEKSSAVNNAAIREALYRIYSRFSIDGFGRHWIRLNEHDWRLIQSTLSSPPRNCDLFDTDEEELLYYKEKVPEDSKYKGSVFNYIKWLFALAKAETKGENHVG